jgi:hypothetical protein
MPFLGDLSANQLREVLTNRLVDRLIYSDTMHRMIGSGSSRLVAYDCRDALYYRNARLLSLEESPAMKVNGRCRLSVECCH